MASKSPSRIFYFQLIALLLFYGLLGEFSIHHKAFCNDDFWLTFHNMEYLHGLPYRDFPPYKSVLGYYFFLPGLLFSSTPQTILLITQMKLWVVFLNIIGLFFMSLWMRKFYSPQSILLSLLIIILSPMFILCSTQVRVDFLAYLFALSSVLLIFENRYFWSGMVLSFGFCICQKDIWFVCATHAAFVMQWFLQYRNRAFIKKIIQFDLGFFLILIAYIIFWSFQSHLNVVLKSLFIEPFLLNNLNVYTQFIDQKIFNFSMNFIWLFLAYLVFLAELFFVRQKGFFEVTYNGVLFLFILTCRQPFLYSFLALVPGLLILLPKTLTRIQASDPFLYHWMYVIPFVLILSYNFAHFYNQIINGRYQNYTLKISEEILTPQEHYIAGNFLLLTRKQNITGFKHLDYPEIQYINYPDKKLLPIMKLSSLYHAPTNIAKIIQNIQETPPKIYIDNQIIHALSPTLQKFLRSQYQHFWASVFLYAPEVPKGNNAIQIHYDGIYKIQSSQNIELNGLVYSPNTYIELKKQIYASKASATYRLVLIPQAIKTPLYSKFKKNNWKYMFA